MLTIGSASHKGGVGKSTLSIHLAGAIAHLREGSKILLVDGDKNRTCLNWYQRGDSGAPFVVKGVSAANKWIAEAGAPDFLIKDTPARADEDLLIDLGESCDLILVPTEPTPFSLDVLDQFLKDMEKYAMGVPYAFVLTRVGRSNAGDESREFLSSQNLPLFDAQMRYYDAYVKGSAQGVLVKDARYQDNGKKDDRAGAAWNDCLAIARELLEALDG